MYKVHAYLASPSTPPRLVIDWRMEHLPRMGDVLRMNLGGDTTFVRVTDVIWCIDEESSEGTRVNLELRLATYQEDPK